MLLLAERLSDLSLNLSQMSRCSVQVTDLLLGTAFPLFRAVRRGSGVAVPTLVRLCRGEPSSRTRLCRGLPGTAAAAGPLAGLRHVWEVSYLLLGVYVVLEIGGSQE